MTTEVAMTWFGTCTGVGLLLGAFIALANSWRP